MNNKFLVNKNEIKTNGYTFFKIDIASEDDRKAFNQIKEVFSSLPYDPYSEEKNRARLFQL